MPTANIILIILAIIAVVCIGILAATPNVHYAPRPANNDLRFDAMQTGQLPGRRQGAGGGGDNGAPGCAVQNRVYFAEKLRRVRICGLRLNRIGVPASNVFLDQFGDGLLLPYPNLLAT